VHVLLELAGAVKRLERSGYFPSNLLKRFRVTALGADVRFGGELAV
jgi:hypothetical protein